MPKKIYVMSELQSDVYEFVEKYIGEHGYSPSSSEIAKGVKASRTSSDRAVDVLVANGKLTRVEGKARTIKLTKIKR